MNTEIIINHNTKEKKKLNRKNKKGLTDEDAVVLSTLEKLKDDLDVIHRSFDFVTDPILIDSYIFEMNAVNMKYKFYINLCKQKGLIGNMF